MRRTRVAVLVPLAACVAAVAGCSGKIEGDQAIVVTPDGRAIQPSGQLDYRARAFGMTNPTVTWSVLETNGGTVDPTGHYVAPPGTGVFTIRATSVQNTNVYGSAQVTVTIPSNTDLIPASRRTTWNPGVPGDIPVVGGTPFITVTPAWAAGQGLAAFDPAAGTGNAAPAINQALQLAGAAAGPGNFKVVYLPAGTYRTLDAIYLSQNYVILRGAGAGTLGVGGTSIRHQRSDAGNAVVYIWPGGQGSWNLAAVNVTADAAKGSTTLQVANAAGFAVGDVIFLDQDNDTSIVWSALNHFIRPADGFGPATPGGRFRYQGTQVAITAKNGNVLTIDPPLHASYKASLLPQVYKLGVPRVMWSGVEDMYLTGGSNEVIDTYYPAYCWIKNVESDGTVASPTGGNQAGPGLGMVGDHIMLSGAFRCTVRRAYVHHADQIVQGGVAYGISLGRYSANNLIEDSIAYWLNKLFTLRATGGGNVVAYNYMDAGWTTLAPSMQETGIDLGHSSFPHMELCEGNWAPNGASEVVWGNAGWMTFFRNRFTGVSKHQPEDDMISSIFLNARTWEFNVIGNVLGTGGVGQQFEVLYSGAHTTAGVPDGGGRYQAAVWRLGSSWAAGAPVYGGIGGGGNDENSYEDPHAVDHVTAYQMTIRKWNYDYVRNQIDDGTGPALPQSLYLTGQPAWWGGGTWPPFNPQGTTDAARVQPLPAKARFDAGTPNG